MMLTVCPSRIASQRFRVSLEDHWCSTDEKEEPDFYPENSPAELMLKQVKDRDMKRMSDRIGFTASTSDFRPEQKHWRSGESPPGWVNPRYSPTTYLYRQGEQGSLLRCVIPVVYI